MMNYDVQEIGQRGQETHMDEQGAPAIKHKQVMHRSWKWGQAICN